LFTEGNRRDTYSGGPWKRVVLGVSGVKIEWSERKKLGRGGFYSRTDHEPGRLLATKVKRSTREKTRNQRGAFTGGKVRGPGRSQPKLTGILRRYLRGKRKGGYERGGKSGLICSRVVREAGQKGVGVHGRKRKGGSTDSAPRGGGTQGKEEGSPDRQGERTSLFPAGKEKFRQKPTNSGSRKREKSTSAIPRGWLVKQGENGGGVEWP